LAISSAEDQTRATSEYEEPVCPKCKGVGYYSLNVRVHDPNFGVPITCHCKQSEKERRAADELFKISNLEPFRDKTFENFDPSVAGVQRSFTRAREFARAPRGWLVLFGNYGCGKTHLAAAIANEALRNHWRVLFTVVPDLLDHLRSTFGPSSEVEYDERFEQVRTVNLLILDDLGTENATPWAKEKLYQIINHRYNHSLPTVITSNRPPKDIDPRIFSRMSDRALCEEVTMIDADDYRRLAVEQRFSTRKRRMDQGRQKNW
jgi:DNA replication protein DnaC